MLVTNGRNEVTIRNTKFVLFFLCIFFISLNSSAQKELQNWYFGTGSDGITFKNGIPEKLNDKYPGIGFEAMIVVNDPVNGDLKFYADGQKVINRNHQVMQNGTGLNGHWSGAQSVQSCPVPGSCSQKFYLFTNSGYDLNPGAISYSIVDFTDNLSGEIKNKNTPLWNGPSDEALCLVNKPNSNDYWLIANRYQTSEYMVWPVTSSGIGTPISYTFSTTGSTYQMNFDKTTKKIVVTGYGNKRVTIIDFNPNSGILSNETQLGPNFGSCFAARFSPDGSKLYASVTPAGSPITTPSVLFQYNFATSVWTDMSGIGACCYAHDIKMGPDGKMYHIHTYYGTQPLAVIEKPNETAINNECNYHNITFSEDFTGEVRRFPEFVTLPSPPTILPDSIVASDVPVIIDVLANDYDYNFSNSTLKIDAIEYGPKFGTAVISQNTIVYTPGSTKCVTDTLIYRARGLDCITDTAYVIIKKPATASYTYIDTTICEGYEYNGHRSSGTYHDTLKNLSGCDSIVVIHLSLSSPSYTHERIEMCEGENYNGHTSTGIYLDTLTTVEGCDSIITTDLLFKTKSYTKLHIEICKGDSYRGYSIPGTYRDTLPAANGCDSIISLTLSYTMPIITTIDTSICYYQTFEGYNTTGVYTDTLTDIHGCDSVRNIKLTVVRAPEPHLGINQELCRGDSIILKPGTFNSYLWQDSSTTDNLIVKEPGTYIVSVTNDCGIARDTVNVTISPCNIYFPNAFSPNNDHLNDLFKILKPIGISNYYLAIYNRWGEKIFETNDISKGWDGTYKGSPMPPGIFIWYSRFAKSGQQEMIKGVLTLLR